MGLPPDYSMPAMAVVHALIRREAKNLRLLGVPVLGLSADLLIGAGCVAKSSRARCRSAKPASRRVLRKPSKRNLLKIKDATCPAIHTGLQATEKGVPFMPLRGRHRVRPRESQAGLAGHRKSAEGK